MDETKKITFKQEQFCQAMALGKTQAESYIEAYDADDMSLSTIKSEACRLANQPHIRRRVQELQAQAWQMRLDAHLAKLGELRDAAVDNRQYSAAITAEVSRGKACGLYIDRSEVKTEVVPPTLVIETPKE